MEKLLEDFEMHGWKPDESLGDDNTFMDIVMLVTRNSYTRQGSMACVLVQPDNSMISVAINQPLFTENDSDVHAEIAALGAASRMGRKTDRATAYITMPPCKRCFAALKVAGIKRIVTRRDPPQTIADCAKKENIEIVVLSRKDLEEQTKRINTLIHGHPNGKKRGRIEEEDKVENNEKGEKVSKS